MRDRADAALAAGPADEAVSAAHLRDRPVVEVVAQEGEGEAARPQVRLGRGVVAGEGEFGVRIGAEEREIDDPGRERAERFTTG
ncbi:hypothetical protein [Cryobacterium sp. GrIS_2_6]|uniref:hypothetical protein n=1 Tax=Cryobacterium sp. GrIS_2_6 TaxID=3162785 RepID=UPI002DFD5065|nr:hypothetical protein [Cryobacterium psychrotolerans]